MPGVDDQAAVARWVYARLTADAGVTALVGERVFPELPPQEESGAPTAVYPFLTFSFNAGRPRRVAGRRARAYSDQYLVIQATDEGEDYDRTVAIMQAVDASLTADDAEGVVDVGGVDHYVSVVGQEQPFRRPDFTRGQQYRNSGRIYRVQVYDR